MKKIVSSGTELKEGYLSMQFISLSAGDIEIGA
jgi:hypothetical protein